MRSINRQVVGAFIFSQDNKILLGLSRKGGTYQGQLIVPGGGLKRGETKLNAAIRETKEEVGIDITKHEIKQLDLVLNGASPKTLQNSGEIVLVNMAFSSFIVNLNRPANQITITCNDDLTKASWYSMTSLSTLNLAPLTKKVLQNIGYL